MHFQFALPYRRSERRRLRRSNTFRVPSAETSCRSSIVGREIFEKIGKQACIAGKDHAARDIRLGFLASAESAVEDSKPTRMSIAMVDWNNIPASYAVERWTSRRGDTNRWVKPDGFLTEHDRQNRETTSALSWMILIAMLAVVEPVIRASRYSLPGRECAAITICPKWNDQAKLTGYVRREHGKKSDHHAWIDQ